jgi:hypothetical protein
MVPVDRVVRTGHKAILIQFTHTREREEKKKFQPFRFGYNKTRLISADS